MYLHPAFKISTDEAMPILRKVAYGIFVVPTGGAPFAAHIPFLVDEHGGRIVAEFHVARANPIHQFIGKEGAPGLLVCSGPDAYLSPDWYGVPNQVPTWVYTAVHLKGTARLLGIAENGSHVDRLSAFFEARVKGKEPWSADKMEDQQKRAAMLKAIVSIKLDISTVEAQKKHIQHKGATEHLGAISGLRSTGEARSLEIADLMQDVAKTKFGT